MLGCLTTSCSRDASFFWTSHLVSFSGHTDLYPRGFWFEQTLIYTPWDVFKSQSIPSELVYKKIFPIYSYIKFDLQFWPNPNQIIILTNLIPHMLCNSSIMVMKKVFFFYGFSLYIPIVQIRSTIVAQPIPWDHFFGTNLNLHYLGMLPQRLSFFSQIIYRRCSTIYLNFPWKNTWPLFWQNSLYQKMLGLVEIGTVVLE